MDTGQDVTRSSPISNGGESACWAYLMCEDCGVVEGDQHRASCRWFVEHALHEHKVEPSPELHAELPQATDLDEADAFVEPD